MSADSRESVREIRRVLTPIYRRAPAPARVVLRLLWRRTLGTVERPTPTPPKGAASADERRLAYLRAVDAAHPHLRVPLDHRPLPAPIEVTGRVSPEPEISVIVTTFNDGEYLAMAIDSVRQQGFQDWECIVVDDGSADDSLLVALSRAELDNRVKVISHRANVGLAACRNTGIVHARGRFLAFLDADDFLFQDSLVKRYDAAVTAVETDHRAVGSWCSWTTTPESADLAYPPGPAPNEPVLTYFVAAGENPVIATSPLLLREVVLSMHGFREDLRTAEDFEFWTRLLRNGFTLWPARHNGVAYRQKRQSLIGDGQVAHAAAALMVYGSMSETMSAEAISLLASAPVLEPPAGIPSPVRLASRLVSFLVFAIASGNERQVSKMAELVQMCDRRILDLVDVGAVVKSALQREDMRRGETAPRVRDGIIARVRAVVAEGGQEGSPPRAVLSPRTDRLHAGRDAVHAADRIVRIDGLASPGRTRRPDVIVDLPGADQRFAAIDLCLLVQALRDVGIDAAARLGNYADRWLADHFAIPVTDRNRAKLRVAASRDHAAARADVVVHLGDWILPHTARRCALQLVRSQAEAELVDCASVITGWPSRSDITRRVESGAPPRQCVLVGTTMWTNEAELLALQVGRRLRNMSWIAGPGTHLSGRTITAGARRRLVPELAAVVSLDGAIEATALHAGVAMVVVGSLDDRRRAYATAIDDITDDRGTVHMGDADNVHRPVPLLTGDAATELQVKAIGELLE